MRAMVNRVNQDPYCEVQCPLQQYLKEIFGMHDESTRYVADNGL